MSISSAYHDRSASEKQIASYFHYVGPAKNGMHYFLYKPGTAVQCKLEWKNHPTTPTDLYNIALQVKEQKLSRFHVADENQQSKKIAQYWVNRRLNDFNLLLTLHGASLQKKLEQEIEVEEHQADIGASLLLDAALAGHREAAKYITIDSTLVVTNSDNEFIGKIAVPKELISSYQLRKLLMGLFQSSKGYFYEVKAERGRALLIAELSRMIQKLDELEQSPLQKKEVNAVQVAAAELEPEAATRQYQMN